VIHKLNNFVLIKDDLSEQRKGSNIVSVHEKGDKTYCSNYRWVSIF